MRWMSQSGDLRNCTQRTRSGSSCNRAAHAQYQTQDTGLIRERRCWQKHIFSTACICTCCQEQRGAESFDIHILITNRPSVYMFDVSDSYSHGSVVVFAHSVSRGKPLSKCCKARSFNIELLCLPPRPVIAQGCCSDACSHAHMLQHSKIAAAHRRPFAPSAPLLNTHFLTQYP